MHNDIRTMLLSEQQIKDRVCELGKRITEDYYGKDLIVVGILKGAVIFFADLVRQIDLSVDFDFMGISSYGNSQKSTGVVRLSKDLDHNIEKKHVLIIEDIVDTGLTLKYLKESLQTRNPASLKICCLLDKPERRECDIIPDYCGFKIPNEFVVGYGLDYSHRYRNLRYIGVLKPEVYKN